MISPFIFCSTVINDHHFVLLDVFTTRELCQLAARDRAGSIPTIKGRELIAFHVSKLSHSLGGFRPKADGAHNR